MGSKLKEDEIKQVKEGTKCSVKVLWTFKDLEK